MTILLSDERGSLKTNLNVARVLGKYLLSLEAVPKPKFWNRLTSLFATNYVNTTFSTGLRKLLKISVFRDSLKYIPAHTSIVFFQKFISTLPNMSI
jgi:hypothetical protein